MLTVTTGTVVRRETTEARRLRQQFSRHAPLTSGPEQSATAQHNTCTATVLGRLRLSHFGPYDDHSTRYSTFVQQRYTISVCLFV
jgi:hypothetical protein